MGRRPRARIFVFNDISRDPRVSRQIDWMRDEYDVSCAGTAPPKHVDLPFTRMEPHFGGSVAKLIRGGFLLLGCNEKAYSRCYGRAYAADRDPPVDLMIANDLDTLPLVVAAARSCGARVVYDSHEFAPKEYDRSVKWRILRKRYCTELTRRYVRKVAAVTTVCRPIAEEFQSLTGVLPEVITNAPDYRSGLAPRPIDPAGPIRLVHHGAAIRSRGLEAMIDAAKLLDPRFKVDFILMPNEPDYLEQIRRSISDCPSLSLLPPVGMRELPEVLNQYDAGLALIQPTNFNERNALPNKFFEFIQARLALAIGPTAEMARIVRETGVGVVADDFRPESLARALNALSADEFMRFKQASHRHAREYSAEPNREKWLTVCRRALDNKQ